MTRFSAANHSSADLKSSREAIWKALTDPELLPELTPYLHNIKVDGNRWTWNVAKVPVLGKSVGTCFTEVMTFDEPREIRFDHDETQSQETTWVQGAYHLEDLGTGTRVSIDLSVSAELPFPGFMRRAVEAGMSAVMVGMGKVFARNLLKHLGEK